MAIQHADAQEPVSPSPEGATFLEQFRPTPLSWLMAWLFRPRHAQKREPEEFEDHINGLA
jgi:hypothetical protein